MLDEAYHAEDSPLRPLRKPLGLFRAHLLRRLRRFPSDTVPVGQLWRDLRLRRICDMEEGKPPYVIGVLSRFGTMVASERLMRIVGHAIRLVVKK